MPVALAAAAMLMAAWHGFVFSMPLGVRLGSHGLTVLNVVEQSHTGPVLAEPSVMKISTFCVGFVDPARPFASSAMPALRAWLYDVPPSDWMQLFLSPGAVCW